MTISTPPPSAESLVPTATPSSADAGGDVATGGFDQLMAAGAPPAPADAEDPAEPDSAKNAPATDQAAALAASILWAPLPLMAETPTPAPTFEGGAAVETTVAQESGELFAQVSAENESQAQSGGVRTEVGGALRPTFGDAVSGVNPDSQKVDATEPSTAKPAIEIPQETVGAAAESEAAATTLAAATSEETPPALFSSDRPAPRRLMRSSDRGEKIADAPMTPAGRLPIEGLKAAKTFVSSTEQEVRGDDEIVGTGVAKTNANMPYAFANHHVSAVPTVSASDAQLQQFEVPASAEPSQQARDVVASVLSVIDAREKSESLVHRSVNMNFDFNGERLAVRVEFRSGAVRAHFQTASSELRAALSAEWSHASAAPENILRAVEPVFTSDRGGQNASFNADGGASRQQQQHASASESAPRALSSSSRSGRSVTVTTSAASDETPRYLQPFTTRHLHAIA